MPAAAGASRIAGALACWSSPAAVHLANEAADDETDRLTPRTPFSGGSGALAGQRTRSRGCRSSWPSVLAGSE